MVRDLIAAYRGRISNLTWMSSQTKQKALAKLGALQVIVGYPDVWIDYSSLDVVALLMPSAICAGRRLSIVLGI